MEDVVTSGVPNVIKVMVGHSPIVHLNYWKAKIWSIIIISVVVRVIVVYRSPSLVVWINCLRLVKILSMRFLRNVSMLLFSSWIDCHLIVEHLLFLIIERLLVARSFWNILRLIEGVGAS